MATDDATRRMDETHSLRVNRTIRGDDCDCGVVPTGVPSRLAGNTPDQSEAPLFNDRTNATPDAQRPTWEDESPPRDDERVPGSTFALFRLMVLPILAIAFGAAKGPRLHHNRTMPLQRRSPTNTLI
jgi:hypothetical protein